jgi:hypothetical protein
MDQLLKQGRSANCLDRNHPAIRAKAGEQVQAVGHERALGCEADPSYGVPRQDGLPRWPVRRGDRQMNGLIIRDDDEPAELTVAHNRSVPSDRMHFNNEGTRRPETSLDSMLRAAASKCIRAPRCRCIRHTTSLPLGRAVDRSQADSG